MKQIEKFNVDDIVKWSSQAHGAWTTKIGIIVEKIKPGTVPPLRRARGARTVESYVIAVPLLHSLNFEYYWPLPSILKRSPIHERPGIYHK